MLSGRIRVACIWCIVLLTLALARVHFRVVTTNVAYHLGQLKAKESNLLEERSSLQAELAKLTGKKQLEGLSGGESKPTEKQGEKSAGAAP